MEPPLMQPIAMWALFACLAPSALHFSVLHVSVELPANAQVKATGRAAAAINPPLNQILTGFSGTL
jgi:hypothetical protein